MHTRDVSAQNMEQEGQKSVRTISGTFRGPGADTPQLKGVQCKEWVTAGGDLAQG